MGIKNFKFFKDKFEPISESKEFESIVIDANNLFIIYLTAFTNEIKLNPPKNDITLEQQTKYIVEAVGMRIKNFISKLSLRYKTSEVIGVLDPSTSPIYNLDREDLLNYKDLNEKYFNIVINDSTVNHIELTLKSNEQERRIKYRNVDKELQKLKETYGEEDWKNKIYTLTSQIIQLRPQLSKWILDNKVMELYTSKNEADLVILNIAYNKKTDTLILSTDADYFFLGTVSDLIYVSDFSAKHEIYHPYSMWREFLGDMYSDDLVFRISPLLGNDYTVHEFILDCKKIDEIKKLFNNSLHLESNRTKFAAVYKILKGGTINNVLELDQLILNYNNEFFKKYYLSVYIYTTWNKYNKFDRIN